MLRQAASREISRPPGLELERYELRAAPLYQFKFARRTFFKLLGSGVLVVCVAKEALAQESGRGGRRGGRGGGGRPQEINAWLHIGEDGTITAFSGKAEVGQNVRTMLTQVVSEELRAPISSIRLVTGDTQLTPYDMGTFGSRSTPDMVPQIRRMAAAARETLLDLAAEQQKTPRDAFTVENGSIKNGKSGESFHFGQITKGEKLVKTVGNDVPTTPVDRWRVCGTSVPKIEAAKFVTGAHKYSSDVTLPGMLHGRLLRAPAFGSKLQSCDTSAAERMTGVKVIRDGDFLGVVAPNILTAERALEAIKAAWSQAPQVNEAQLVEQLRGRPAPTKAELEGAAKTLQATYTVAYIAHAPLEPRAAVAQWEGEKLTVWTGSQRPFGVRDELAQAFHLQQDQVRVIVPDTGSGYGGKHTGEAAIEAARLAKTAGKPVKLVWTREEEFTWAYFRPAGVIDVAAGIDAAGKLTHWKFDNYNSGGAGIRMTYDVPNPQANAHGGRSPLPRQGSYRALAATANHFARESAMDELAHLAKVDPLEFRLMNAKDFRLRGVIEAVARAFDWKNKKSSKTTGYGIAAGTEKGSYVATCAEIAIDPDGKVAVKHVVQAFECGPVMNPEHLKNQNEGAIMMGIGGALFEAIHFADGKILNPRFSEYRVARFSDLPRIEVVLVNRKDIPSAGAGETPIIGIAPAIANAIFAATGKRVRTMPLLKKGVLA